MPMLIDMRPPFGTAMNCVAPWFLLHSPRYNFPLDPTIGGCFAADSQHVVDLGYGLLARVSNHHNIGIDSARRANRAEVVRVEEIREINLLAHE